MINSTDISSLSDVKIRCYRGEQDIPNMLPVMLNSSDADGRQHTGATVEEVVRQYAHLSNSNPLDDVLLAEVAGKIVAYSRCYWEQEESNNATDLLLYRCVVYVLPEWREKGLGEVVFQQSEKRLKEIAKTHSENHPKLFEAGAYDTEQYWLALYKKFGYEPVRHFQEMERPNLDDIPQFSLPDSLEIRPVLPEQYRTVWESDNEAFRDHWGFTTPMEVDYSDWLSDKETFQPERWQVAWDKRTGEVAGQVRAYINAKWNEKYDCQQGYIDVVSVRKPWRRQGVARALLTRSLAQLKAAGMTSAELDADSDNSTGATHLYTDCGFQVIKRSTLYRKPLLL